MRSMLDRDQSILSTAATKLRVCVAALRISLAFAAVFAYLMLSPVSAQQTESKSVIVQPGAPGQPTRTLPSTTKATLPPPSQKDVEFMQGMIMHHAQAVEMTAMIEGRTQNAEIRLLGDRIAASQADEMMFMRRWLAVRGEKAEMKMPSSGSKPGGSHSHGAHDASSYEMKMPGMLSAQQMAELGRAKGKDFDRLFLLGMIQHHRGALDMVKSLFATPGAGLEAEIFNFATEVDTGQLAEIKIMQTLLAEKQ